MSKYSYNLVQALIEESEVTPSRLFLVFRDAGYDIGPADEDDPADESLYLTSDDKCSGFFLSINTEARLVNFFAYAKLKTSAVGLDLEKLCAELNETAKFVRYTHTRYDDGRAYVNGSYAISFFGGLLLPQLLRTAKAFVNEFRGALKASDTDMSIFL